MGGGEEEGEVAYAICGDGLQAMATTRRDARRLNRYVYVFVMNECSGLEQSALLLLRVCMCM